MEYNWTIDDIKKRVYILFELYERSTNVEEKALIKAQIDYTQGFLTHISSNYQQPKIMEAYQDLKKYIFRDSFTFNTMYGFLDNIDGFSFCTPSELKLANDDIIDILHDFYKSLSKEIYCLFLDFYNMRNNHIRFSQIEKNSCYSCCAYSFPTLQEYFIEICKKGTITDLTTSIHEAGHAIWGIANKNYAFFDNKYISELIPMAMELIACDYLEKLFGEQAIKEKGVIHALEVVNIQKWALLAELIAIEKEAFGEYKSSEKIEKVAFKMGISKNELESLLNIAKFPETSRTIAYIYAIELYSLYKKDPEMACHVMEKIMKDTSKTPEESINMLEKLGLVANEHSSEYHQKLVLKLEN